MANSIIAKVSEILFVFWLKLKYLLVLLLIKRVFVVQVVSLRLVPVAVLTQPSRTTTTKHYNPKYKKMRAQKYMKFELPDFSENAQDMSQEKMRQKMKERGLIPPRPWIERAFYISATGQ